MVRKGFVALFITGEKVGEGDEFSHLCGPSAVGALGNEGDNGMVSLVHVAPPKHFVESCERFGSACENHKATHGTIESMHGAEKDFAGFVVLLFDIGFDLVGQRSIAGAGTEKQIVRTASRQLRELSCAEGQNESGKVAQVFAALTFQPY